MTEQVELLKEDVQLLDNLAEEMHCTRMLAIMRALLIYRHFRQASRSNKIIFEDKRTGKREEFGYEWR